jgi:hypothetical protein
VRTVDRGGTSDLIPLADAIQIAGDDLWRNVPAPTRKMYLRQGIPASRLASLLWRWWRSKRPVPAPPPPEPKADPELEDRLALVRRHYKAAGAESTAWAMAEVGMVDEIQRRHVTERATPRQGKRRAS